MTRHGRQHHHSSAMELPAPLSVSPEGGRHSSSWASEQGPTWGLRGVRGVVGPPVAQAQGVQVRGSAGPGEDGLHAGPRRDDGGRPVDEHRALVDVPGHTGRRLARAEPGEGFCPCISWAPACTLAERTPSEQGPQWTLVRAELRHIPGVNALNAAGTPAKRRPGSPQQAQRGFARSVLRRL